MSSGIIENIDVIEGIEKFWHGKNIVKPFTTFEKSCLNWGVYSVPLIDEMTGEPIHYLQVKGDELVEVPYQRIVDNNRLTLNIVKGRYEIVQNSAVWEVVRILKEEYGFEVASNGSIHGRKRCFMTLEAPDSAFEVKEGDKHQLRVNVTWSHDGSCKIEFYNNTIRIVCANTWRFSMGKLAEMSDQGKEYIHQSARHTKNVHSKLKDIKAFLIDFYNEKQALKESLQGLDAKPINATDATNVIVGFMANGDKLSTRAAGQSANVLNLFLNGKGNMGKTQYDLFNGFTEFFTHGTIDDTTEDNKVTKQVLSSEFGEYADKKTQIFDAFLSDETLDKLAANGAKLIESAETNALQALSL